MKPISLFIPGLEGGGAQRVFTTLANAFVDLTDYPVELVLVRDGGALREEIRSEVKVVNLNTERVSRSIPALVQYLRHTKPGVFCSTLNYCNIISVVAWRLAGRPCRLVLREANVATTADARMRLLMRLIYPQADCVISLSPEVGAHLLAAGIQVQNKMVEIGNPINVEPSPERFSPLDFLPNPTTRFICAVGSLTQQKGFDVLITAFSRLADASLHLVILGEGELRQDLKSQCRTLGVADRVHMPGFVKRPTDVIRQSQLFVLSSRWEGFPNVLLEALSTGIPVVATDCPGAPRSMLENGLHGHLVESDNIDALLTGIQAGLCAPIGTTEGRINRAKDFAVEKIARQYLEEAFKMTGYDLVKTI